MSNISVTENPRLSRPRKRPLAEAALQHLELIEIFLKLLPHFQKNESGSVHDEALAYSEWRYINYLRFLDVKKLVPCSHPPPWDVALIWYLHLLSPVRFHQYLWDTQCRIGYITFGLAHRQFPLKELLSAEWSPKSERRAWEAWANLPYQLWQSPPWKQAQTAPSSPGLFSCFRKNYSMNGKHKVSSSSKRSPVVMHQQDSCYYGLARDLPKKTTIEDYTRIRTWQRDEQCHNHLKHETSHEYCALRPWPSIHDLRDDLERQIPFWRTLLQAKSSDSSFVYKLPDATLEYEYFITLFRGRLLESEADKHESQIDHKLLLEYNIEIPTFDNGPSPAPQRDISLLPPGLEVDLLWHTHRLFPAMYWLDTMIKAGWVLEFHPLHNTEAAKYSLERTKKEWQNRYKTQYLQGESCEDLLEQYIPYEAIFAPEDAQRGKMRKVINGYRPDYRHLSPRKPQSASTAVQRIRETPSRDSDVGCCPFSVSVSADVGGGGGGGGGGD